MKATTDPDVSSDASSDVSTAPSQKLRRHRWRRAAGIGLPAAAGTVAVLLFTVPAVSGVSWGTRWGAATERITIDHYGNAAALPEGAAPSFLPRDAEDVTLKRPRPSASDGDGAGVDDAVAVDARVPEDWAPPTECTPTGYSQPFDGGGDWPLSTSSALLSCPDPTGSWTVLASPSHVYAWR